MELFTGMLAFLLALQVQAGNGQSVQMDSSKSGFVGSQVELRCIFINSNPPVKISQVTWQKLVNATKQNVAIANPALGVSVLPPFKERVGFKQAAVRHRPPSLEDTTIVFSNLQLSDEAAYICEYTTFPAGNRENMVNLTVFARPMTRMTLTTPTIVARGQKRKMTVATCVSANGKPPSVIKWDTRLKGEATYQETRNQNGTVTVRSNYVVIPSRETHKQKLTCIVMYRSERITDSVVLNVQYEPEVMIEGFDGNWYLNRQNVQLTCRADANPPVTIYQWKLLNGSIPSNVEIKNNTLFFKGPVTYDLAGTYVCDATNGIGTRTGSVDVNITALDHPTHFIINNNNLNLPINPTPRGHGVSQDQHSAGAAIGGAVGGGILLILAAILVFVFLRRRQRTFKGDYSTKKHVFGNGYSKAGGLPAHPPIPKNLQYPDDSDDEKKPAQIGNTGGFEASERNFDAESEDLKRPYFTVDEGESRDYEERTLAFQYDPEPEIADDMISQTDGSVISKKEWYV
ncbi:nectin cell adhesion molecule 1b isoform X5 [Girardinichthys multiradiatus]|uniref:nectin cell adhesion molecule 1b isoform X5 n=1 Tax=Girardinichthys multiradiatus TaxID=208333 RepID=UPI001FAC864A|nr:nectin cell adhesion molecule 1b isoform X5 [Girardinichthys multiradiatus]